MPPDPAAPPAPRRILLDGTGWTLVREGGEAAGLSVASLPTLGQAVADRHAVRQRLVETDVLLEDGRPTRTVHAALAVLTTAAVEVTVARRQAERTVAGRWRTLGGPTAGVIVREATTDGAADGDADGDLGRGVELQLLAIDDLATSVVDELLGPDTGDEDPLRGDGAGHVDVELAADDPTGWPEGVVVDGEVLAQATVAIEGPAGTSVARLWGDGRRWWQVGATGPDRLRAIAVTRSTVRDTVVAALAGQLGSEAPAGGGTGGAGRG